MVKTRGGFLPPRMSESREEATVRRNSVSSPKRRGKEHIHKPKRGRANAGQEPPRQRQIFELSHEGRESIVEHALVNEYCVEPVMVNEVPEVYGNEFCTVGEHFGIGGDDFGDVGDDIDDDTDRVVPPVDISVECGLQEEECDDLREQFGVTEIVEDKGSDSEEDVEDDEKIPEPLSSDDDEEETARNNDVCVSVDPDELLKLGKCFSTPEDFKLAVFKYCLKSRYDIKFYKSQSLKIGAKCNDKEQKCEWRCYAAYEKKKHKMQIKVYVDVHTCVRSGYCRLLKQGTVAWLFADRLRVNPKMTKQEIAAEIKREYNMVISEDVCGKAKSILAKQRRQSHEAHFSRIWDYQAEVLLSNAGSVFEIETTPGPSIGSKQRFYRLFMCFKAQRDSWKTSCRPIIGLDGAFLKWDIRGHLLAAVGRDGDNRIVPIAWAVVEIESDDNWDWFVRLLSGNLGLGEGKDVAILSDKQKGLIKAVHTVLPQAEHRQCARHIMDNWKRDSHDMELQRLFWKIARSYNQGEFSTNMDALQKYNPYSYDTLLRTMPATWSRAFFRIGSCCPDVLNNLCESFNRTIRAARRKPLLELLEDIRRQCMVRNEKRSRIAERLQTRFTKRAHAEIEKMVSGSQFCNRYMARNDLHEVELGGIGYRVNMNDCTCGCRKWQVTGIPCVHASAVIIGKKQKVEDYVSEYYTTEMWRMTYKDGIAPVQSELLWPRMNRLGVLPPPWRRGNPGRPSNYARKKGINESQQPPTKMTKDGRVMTCSNCKQEGHNKSTCANERVELPPKKPRGRPQKGLDIMSSGQGSQTTHGSKLFKLLRNQDSLLKDIKDSLLKDIKDSLLKASKLLRVLLVHAASKRLKLLRWKGLTRKGLMLLLKVKDHKDHMFKGNV